MLLPYHSPAICRGSVTVDYSALARGDITALLDALLPETEIGFRLKGLDYILNIAKSEIIDRADGYFTSGDLILSIEKFESLKERTIQLLSAFHAKNPSVAGLGEATLPDLIKKEGGQSIGPAFTGRALFKVLIEHLIDGGLIKRGGLSYRSHGPQTEPRSCR